MKTKTIWYSVSNGGDGSAYPHWMESLELAEWDQDHMDEGWGESCTGSITISSQCDIEIKEKVLTKEGYFLKNYAYGFYPDDDEAVEFINKFFPDGLPVFDIIIDEMPNPSYVGVCIKGSKEVLHSVFIGVDGKYKSNVPEGLEKIEEIRKLIKEEQYEREEND